MVGVLVSLTSFFGGSCDFVFIKLEDNHFSMNQIDILLLNRSVRSRLPSYASRVY